MLNEGMTGLWRWNIFWWKVEGREPLNGINVYHPDDPVSAGFIVRAGAFCADVRYDKGAKRWAVLIQKRDANAAWLPFSWSLTFGTKDDKK